MSHWFLQLKETHENSLVFLILKPTLLLCFQTRAAEQLLSDVNCFKIQLVQEIQNKCFWNSLLRLNANYIRSGKISNWWLSKVTEKREDFECVIIHWIPFQQVCIMTHKTYMLNIKVLLQHNLCRYYNRDIVTLWDQIYVCLRHFFRFILI